MEDLSDSPLCERKIKRSLIISPNLDALLEHEEKTRARISSIVSEMTTSSFSSRSVSPSEEFPVGLPPPPRHLQRLKSSRATVKGLLLPLEDTEPQARETVAKHAPISVSVPATSSSTSNPYINPAPTLAELIVDIPPDYQSRLPSGPRDSSPIIFTSPWSSVGEDESRPSASRVLRRPYDVPRQICGDRQRQSDTDNKPWQRPLNTHAKRPSTSPAFTHPFSSHEPSNTEECEPRISISSTIYPPSDSHSHSPSFYNDSVFSLAKQDRMEIYPLSQKTEFNLDSTSIDCPQLSPIQFSKLSVSFDRSSPRSSKPVLPATPKPVFNRGPGISRQLYPFQTERLKTNETALPTTTNFLDSEARADLVRKTRKLARVFGQTPVVDTTPAQEPSLMSRCSSVLNDLDWPILRRRRSAFQSESEPSLLNGVRRHSMPLSPVDIPFMTNVSPTYQGYLSPSNDQAGYHAQVHIGPANPSVDTGGVTAAVMSKAGRSSNCTSVQSLEKMSEEDQVVEYRKRKREKLAKLHRFLGSRVPVNLVLGIDDAEASLPPPCLSPTSLESADSQKTWLKRRKSSSAILSSPHWHNNLERVKEELNNKEKLINVRRAVKMEKVFGVAPPQTLYHTRYCSPPLLLASNSAPETAPPTRTASPVQRNPNRSAYLKYKPKKNDRPRTSESNMQLLSKNRQASDDVANEWGSKHSPIYDHYQHSLNSLHDILARDDRESLVELHQYLNAGGSPQIEVSPVASGRRMSNASSIGRRRSLPAMTSLVSLDSEYSATTQEANVATFQERRRKAAKLTQFFGVDYRELINDILQSIENGLVNEHEDGTLRTEEVEDLLGLLRNLKAKRQSFGDMD